MGNARLKPDRLAEKLRQIRGALGLSQTEMLRQLGFDESMKYARISEFEQGQREPNLMTLLAYARAAGVHVEDIIDDDLDLYFRHEVDAIFGAAVHFGVALLATEAFHFADGHAFDAYFTEGVFHFLQFEGFDDCFDFLHEFFRNGVCGLRTGVSRTARSPNGWRLMKATS